MDEVDYYRSQLQEAEHRVANATDEEVRHAYRLLAEGWRQLLALALAQPPQR